jgi:hypothetical protein
LLEGSDVVFALRHGLISVVRQGEVIAADRNAMWRFLNLRYVKAQWVKWLGSLARCPTVTRSAIMNNNMIHAIGPGNASELGARAALIHGFAGASAPHSENHVAAVSKGSSVMNSKQNPQYEIRFQSLYNEGRALTFPCDAQGHVEMDALSEKARLNYLYARAVVGREYAAPAVREAELH